jgi:hypothetical protein
MADDIEIAPASDSITQVQVGAQHSLLAEDRAANMSSTFAIS